MAGDGSGVARSPRPAYSAAMNPTDEFRFLNHLVDALASGRWRLFENGQDITDREIGRLSGEVAAIESMLSTTDAGERDQ
jgi:hypothetical protein